MAENRYSKGKIYKLVNDVDDEIYVGSTCLTLAKRFYEHKHSAKYKPLRIHHHLNEIGWDTVKIILVEEFSCENKMQLLQRERYWIDALKPTLNKTLPLRTVQEWRDEHKEDKAEYDRHYRTNNKLQVSQRRKARYNESKEKHAEHMKHYYENNKSKLAEQRKEKVACECGCEIRKLYLPRHKKSKKHQQWLQNQPSTSYA